MNSTRPVFLSFSSKDSESASQLCAAIESQGIGCFYAPRDVPAGGNFAQEIVTAIAEATVVVVLISESSLRSPHVRREVSLSLDERRLLLPFALPETRATINAEWRYWLSAVQIVDYASAAATASIVVRNVKELTARAAQAATGVMGHSSAPPSPRAGSLVRVEAAPLQSTMPPSALLRAAAETVPFQGREDLLARLTAWIQRDGQVRVRLVAGPGGSGKTRFARQLCRILEATGWETGFLSPGAAINPVALDATTDTLLVVDYAETCVEQVRTLACLGRAALRAKVRILLLARTDGDWWSLLQSEDAALEELLAQSPPLRLTPLGATPAEARRLYRASRAAFAAALGVTDRPEDWRTADSSRSALEIQALALLDVLERREGGTTGDEEPHPIGRLLNHERRYVRAALAGDGLTDQEFDLDQMLATASLLGAGSEQEAVDVVRRADPFADTATLRKIVRLIRRLYPRVDAYLGGLQPDLLAEELVAEVIGRGDDPGRADVFPQTVLTAATSAQLERALTVLGAAAGTHPPVAAALARALHALPIDRVAVAIRVATTLSNPTALAEALRRAIAAAPSTFRSDEVLALMPDETVALAEVAADLCGRLLSEKPMPVDPDEPSPSWQLLRAAANWFSDAGRTHEAVVASERAAAQLRFLASRDPSKQADLGATLSSFSNRLWETGRREAAFDAAAEGAAILERCDGAPPAIVAAALNNLSFRQADLGRYAEGLATARRAIARFRTLSDGRDFSRSGLASALNNCACINIALGDFAAATAAGDEGVTLRRLQVQEHRDRFVPNLARILTNTAMAYLGDGQQRNAEDFAREAVDLHLALATRRSVFAWELVGSSFNLITILWLAGQPDAAQRAWADVANASRNIDIDTTPAAAAFRALGAFSSYLTVPATRGLTLQVVTGTASFAPATAAWFVPALEYKDL